MGKLGNKRLICAGLPMLFYGPLAVEASAQIKPMVVEILPPAKSGVCYAKVSVPAEYGTEMVVVMLKKQTERRPIYVPNF